MLISIFTGVMKSLGVDGYYTGGLVLYEGLVRARDEHKSQTNVEPVYYYQMSAPELMGNT